MTLCLSVIFDIVPPKLNWQIKVRIRSLWKVHSWNDHNTITSLEMILIDEKCSSIQASVKSTLISEFDSNLEEGSCYIISNILVGLHDPKFIMTDHKYKINFIKTTSCTTIGDVPSIPKTYFKFVTYPQVLTGLDQTRAIDVIGHVIKKFDMKETIRSGIRVKLLDIVLEDLEGNNVDCTLWVEHAEQMNAYLTDNGYDKSVIVILQLCKPKIFQCKLENGNKSLNQMISYVSSQRNNVSMDDFLKHPKMTIFEVLQCSKVSTVVVLAKTIDFDHTKKWYYQACTRCSRSVRTKSGDLYFCESCVDVLPANPRIKIHVQVVDVSESSTFILFDRVATQELENPSLNLFEDNNDVTLWSAVFNSLLDKTMLFKIHVSNDNIEKKWQSYTVVKITTDQNLIDQFKMKHDIHDMNDNDEIYQVSNNHTEVEDNLSKESVAEEFNQAYDKNNIDESTPTTLMKGKRVFNDVEVLSTTIKECDVQASTTKMPKFVHIKKEPAE